MRLANRGIAPVAPSGHGVTEPDVDGHVRQYLDLVEEGAPPSLSGFLQGVPEALREEVFRSVDAALANRGAEDAHLLPEVELVLVSSPPRDEVEGRRYVTLSPWDRRLACLGLLFPRRVRHEYVAEMLATRVDARAAGHGMVLAALRTVRDVVIGIAQHAPLQMLPAELGDRSPLASAGHMSWRLSGPALFAGCLLGSVALLTAGGLLLAVSLGCLIALAGYGLDRECRPEVAFANTVLGGSVAVLAVATFLGAATAVLVAMAAALDDPRVAAVAAKGLLLAVAALLCAVTLSRGTPEPWEPRRLVRLSGV